MDKNTMYLGIGATAAVAVLVIVGMVLASGYAGTMTSLQTGTQSSLNSVSDRLNALKTETDQLNATASLNLLHTDALSDALEAAADDLAGQISAGNTGVQNALSSVNSSLSGQMYNYWGSVSNDLGDVNSSLSDQMTVMNANITGSLNVINTGLSNQLTTVYNNLHGELSSAYSGIIGSINTMNGNMNTQFGNLNANLSAVNASIISQIVANNGSLSDLLLAMNMSLSDYLALVQGNLTDLEQKLWSLDDSVKNDTKQIQTIIDDINTMNSSINVQLANLDYQTFGTGKYTLPANTTFEPNVSGPPPAQAFHVLSVSLPQGETAKFTVTAKTSFSTLSTLYAWVDVNYGAGDSGRSRDTNMLELTYTDLTGTTTFVANSFLLRLDVTDSIDYDYYVEWSFAAVAPHGTVFTVEEG